MKRLVSILLFCTPVFASAQFMEMKKSTHTRSAAEGTKTMQDTYTIDFEKSTLTWFQVDSVKSIADKKKLGFTFSKVVMTTTKTDVEWSYNTVTRDSSAGLFQLKLKKVPAPSRSSNGPKAENEKADFSKGIIIYCTDNRKPREIKIESFFEMNETPR